MHVLTVFKCILNIIVHFIGIISIFLNISLRAPPIPHVEISQHRLLHAFSCPCSPLTLNYTPKICSFSVC